MPMASERPISVSTFSVKPKNRIAMNAATTEIGSVSPVITVDRQEFRKRKTMKTVRRPPRTSVTWTSSIDSRMKVESSRTTCSATPGGSSGARRRDGREHAVGDAHRVGARLLLHVQRDRRPVVDERQAARLLDAVDDLRDVAHEHRAFVDALHGNGGDIGRRPALRRHPHHRLGRAAIGRARRGIDVLLPELLDDLGQRQPVRLEPLRSTTT